MYLEHKEHHHSFDLRNLFLLSRWFSRSCTSRYSLSLQNAGAEGVCHYAITMIKEKEKTFWLVKWSYYLFSARRMHIDRHLRHLHHFSDRECIRRMFCISHTSCILCAAGVPFHILQKFEYTQDITLPHSQTERWAMDWGLACTHRYFTTMETHDVFCCGHGFVSFTSAYFSNLTPVSTPFELYLDRDRKNLSLRW